jgi:hypothetical protein
MRANLRLPIGNGNAFYQLCRSISHKFLNLLWFNRQMSIKSKAVGSILAFVFVGANLSPAAAHQPVLLTNTNSTADKGPILVDGTISFAIRANFTKANQTQGFRASLKAGELVNFEYLIVDRAPENKLANDKLPVATITDPAGKKVVIKFTERSKFFEPYGRTNYLYLARYSQTAVDGIYKFTLQSKAKAAITVAVGSKETFGEVLTAATCPAWEKPMGESIILQAYAESLVGMKKESAQSCAVKLGWQYRIGQEDDQLFALTRDYRLDRVTVTIKSGLISQALVG